MQPLGKNAGGYRGETVELEPLLRDFDAAARAGGWTRDGVDGGDSFFAYRRVSPTARRGVYLSSGIHGDEPAGPLAMLRLMQEDQWGGDFSLWLCPCLNPAGLARNTRENAAGLDLNRDYRHLQSAEIRAHVAWLAAQPVFDLALCLHEDWEAKGFYLYELAPEGRALLGEHIVDKVAAVCPVDPSPVIEDRPAKNGVIRPSLIPAERPQWPESLYFIAKEKARQTCTLEAPSDFPLATRVDALATAVRAALEALGQR